MFFNRLALSDLRKNAHEEKMFIFACMAVCALNLVINLLQDNTENVSDMVNTVSAILKSGCFIIGCFSVFFLIYVHNFLMKSKTKMYGLYYLLGLSRSDLIKITFFSKVWNFVFSMIGGILSGIIFTKALILLLAKMLDTPNIHFSIHLQPIMIVTLFFLAIFFLLLWLNIRTIYKVSPIQLLHAEEAGEREPKARWVLAVIGFICLGIGYTISMVSKLSVDQGLFILLFMVAVILVIVGTYLLFLVGTIALLKFFKKREKIYYQPRNFISISGMIFRMKQNGISLANITILLTMTLITWIFTINLYFSIDIVMDKLYSRDIMLSSELPKQKLDEFIAKQADKNHLLVKNAVVFEMSPPLSGKLQNNIVNREGAGEFLVMTERQYSVFEKKSLDLKANQVVIFTSNPKVNESNNIQFGESKYDISKIIRELRDFPKVTSMVNDIFIVKDEVEISKIEKYYEWENKRTQTDYSPVLETHNLFDIQGTQKNKDEFLKSLDYVGKYLNKEQNKKNYKSFISGLSFIGFLLGANFILAVGLIVYHKQISEGQADKKNFDILQKVGLSHKEVKKIVNLQVFWTFFLPIAITVLHTIFAMKMITQMLADFQIDNKTIIMYTSVIILGIILLYYIVYKITSKAYYQQVER
ncbi:MAG: hypothetical protein LBT69_00440 [Lactobacillales bacterium]|jgi:putative ABC transport system permease protein|nr:hypothetical protein [Lactobacillales bacterium]